jgi:hypothetical protein
MENENIIEHTLNGLLQKTIEKRIPWKLVNANALRWTKVESGKTINVTLQQQPHPQPTNSNFILTIQGPNPTSNTQINSASQPTYKEILRSLFNEAMKIGNAESLEVLKRLLEGL